MTLLCPSLVVSFKGNLWVSHLVWDSAPASVLGAALPPGACGVAVEDEGDGAHLRQPGHGGPQGRCRASDFRGIGRVREVF